MLIGNSLNPGEFIYRSLPVNLLVGHTGILSMTPVLLLGWLGMARTVTRGSATGVEASSSRILAALTMALTVMTPVFYVIRTEGDGRLRRKDLRAPLVFLVGAVVAVDDAA